MSNQKDNHKLEPLEEEKGESQIHSTASTITTKRYINQILDEMGFTRYHILIFVANSLVLICGGIERIIHVILLSIIKDLKSLTYYHLALMSSIEYFGYTLSSILVNVILNYVSAKKSIIIFIISSLVFTGLSLTNLNFYFAAFNRFFVGICLGIVDILIYLNLFECAPTKIRGFISSLIMLFFPLGEFIFCVICYFQLNEGNHKLNYRMMLLMPFIVTCVISLFPIFMQESPRRLFGHNQFQEGVETVKKITMFNKDDSYLNDKFKRAPHHLFKRANTTNNQSPKATIENFANNYQQAQEKLQAKEKESNKKNNFNLLKLFEPKYRTYTILFWIMSSLGGFVFNGIFFMLPATAPKIEKATFLDLILFEGIEIPANFIASLLIENKKIGRLNVLRIGFILTFSISLITLSLGHTILLLDCFLKFFLTIPFNCLIIYSSEIYESEVRVMGVSAVNFWRRIASLGAPFVLSFMTITFNEYSTYFIYAPCLFISSITSLYLKKESLGIPLDEMDLYNIMV